METNKVDVHTTPSDNMDSTGLNNTDIPAAPEGIASQDSADPVSPDEEINDEGVLCI